MHPKRLVIDANILIRAVLGSRVRNLIERHCDTVSFYVAEANAEEAEFYLANVLAAKHRLDDVLWRSVFVDVMNTVQIIADDILISLEGKAKARIASRDINDWPAVAASSGGGLSLHGLG